MKLKIYEAPYIRHRDSTRAMMVDILVSLLPLVVMACYYYGFRALAISLLSVATCVLSEWVCIKLRKKAINTRDLSSVVTGLIIALLMPASIDYRIVVVAGIFAIVVAKHPFGGTGYNIFNPAACGFAFVAICWPSQVFSYPVPMQHIALFGENTARVGQSMAYSLKLNILPTTDIADILFGNVSGPMGAVNILVIFTCLLFLIFQNVVKIHLPAGILLSCAIFSLLFPRAGYSAWETMTYELLSGFLLFAIVFMCTDPVTKPKRAMVQFVYGLCLGVAIMLFRYFGGFEEGAVFAIILMNALVPIFDNLGERVSRWIRRLDI